MAGLVIIEDKQDHFLTFDLADILPLLAPEAGQLHWAILELEALGTLPDARYRQEEIEQSPHGLLLTWDELQAVATALRQTIWGVFVGCKDAADIPQLRDVPQLGPDPKLYAPCDIVVEAIDSSYWQVYAREDRLLQRLRDRFHDVKDAPLPLAAADIG